MKNKYNPEMVRLEKVSSEDELTLNDLIFNHYKYTQSPIAKKILDNLKKSLHKFVKVMPLEYKRVLSHETAAGKAGAEEVLDG